MKYHTFSYLYPPRPDNAIPPNMLGFYEQRGYVCQLKKNGTGNVMAISPDRQIIAMNRHHDVHKLWTPDEITRRAFLDLPGDGWYYLVAELLHSKVIGMRHINYINDILVADGEYLIGTTFAQRQNLLAALFPNAVTHIDGGYKVIDANTWLAVNHKSGFAALFDALGRKKQPEDEGLVLKNPNAKLAYCTTAKSNSSWQVKCRISTKNYSF
jgi:hypothetical protein